MFYILFLLIILVESRAPEKVTNEPEKTPFFIPEEVLNEQEELPVTESCDSQEVFDEFDNDGDDSDFYKVIIVSFFTS